MKTLSERIESGKRLLANFKEVSSQIADGYANLFLENLDLLSPEAQAIYAERFGHCLACPMRVGNACSKHQKHKRVDADCYIRGCGCQLAAATKSPSKYCVLHKWAPIDPDTLETLAYPPDKRKNPCT